MDVALSRAVVDRVPRRRDRRLGFEALLVSLTESLNRGTDASIRRAFEESLQRFVPVRSIQLREGGRRRTGTSDVPTGTELIALDVPSIDAGSGGMLEATFDP